MASKTIASYRCYLDVPPKGRSTFSMAMSLERLRRSRSGKGNRGKPRTRHAVEWASALTGRRARIPVTFATAKLMPFRLRAGGTPGIGRGQPEAR